MNRLDLIHEALSYNRGVRYLEIGVRTCSNLFKVQCKEKIGVDPAYKLSKRSKLNRFLRLERSKLFRMYSDDFFKKNPSRVLDKGFDVIFVDGLHNYEQSLRDVENGLKFLNPKGVIILHDCNPKSDARATPVKKSFEELIPKIKANMIEGWDGGWNGDVWKTIVHLRATRKDLKIITIDDDQGLGVIMKNYDGELIQTNFCELKNANYSYLAENREYLLNLQPSNTFKEFLNS